MKKYLLAALISVTAVAESGQSIALSIEFPTPAQPIVAEVSKIGTGTAMTFYCLNTPSDAGKDVMFWVALDTVFQGKSQGWFLNVSTFSSIMAALQAGQNGRWEKWNGLPLTSEENPMQSQLGTETIHYETCANSPWQNNGFEAPDLSDYAGSRVWVGRQIAGKPAKFYYVTTIQ